MRESAEGLARLDIFHWLYGAGAVYIMLIMRIAQHYWWKSLGKADRFFRLDSLICFEAL